MKWMKDLFAVSIAVASVCTVRLTAQAAIAWPYDNQNAEHTISCGFGQYQDYTSKACYYHTGIDLPASSGTDVKAPANGWVSSIQYAGDIFDYIIMRQNQNNDDGWKVLYGHVILLDLDGGVWSQAVINSINSGTPVAINQGTRIADVRHEDNWVPGASDHVHYNHYENNVLKNPLQCVTPAADAIDPWDGEYRYRTDANAGQNVYFGTSNPALWGNIDVIANGMDEFEDTWGSDWNLNVFGICFGLARRNVSGALGNLTTAAVHTFDGYYPNVANTASVTYEDSASCDSQGQWNTGDDYWYIVSNNDADDDYDATDIDRYWDTDGRSGDNWNDNAQNDAHEGLCSEVARFPDGEYEVTVKLLDESGNDMVLDHATRNIRLDNYRPYLKGVWLTGPGIPTCYRGDWGFNGSNNMVELLPASIENRAVKWLSAEDAYQHSPTLYLYFSETLADSQNNQTWIETSSEATFGSAVSLTPTGTNHDQAIVDLSDMMWTHAYDGWHRQIKVTAEDTAGNALLAITDPVQGVSFDPKTYVKRNATGTMPGGGGADQYVHRINVDTRYHEIVEVSADPDPVMFSEGQSVTITIRVRDPWPSQLRDGSSFKSTLTGELDAYILDQSDYSSSPIHTLTPLWGEEITLTWDTGQANGYYCTKNYVWNGSGLTSFPATYYILVFVRDEAGNLGVNESQGAVQDHASADPCFIQASRHVIGFGAK